MSKNTDTVDFIHSLKTAAVRHLASAIFAAPLLNMLSKQTRHSTRPALAPSFEKDHHHEAPLFLLDREQQAWLISLDKKPQNLLRFITTQRHYKLGIYHERLWQYFLRHHPKTQLLASNLVVRDTQHTLGEFDILYRHAEIGVVHLELACKYYLSSDSDSNQWPQWIGPGGRDRLDLKLEHCLKNQINLADHPAAQKTLQEKLGLNETELSISKQIHISGRLFYPFISDDLSYDNVTSSLLEGPQHINPHHHRGYWLRLRQWQRLCREQSLDYRPLAKLDWLDISQKIRGDKQSTITTTNELPQLFLCRGALFKKSSRHCLIIPDDWPTIR